jgi:hypothetical protein
MRQIVFISLSLRRSPRIGGTSLPFSFNLNVLVYALRVLAWSTKEIIRLLLLRIDLPLRAISTTPLGFDLRLDAELLLALHSFDALLLVHRVPGTSFRFTRSYRIRLMRRYPRRLKSDSSFSSSI